VTMGDNVPSIGSYAFSDCISLESITVGNAVRGIGAYAFQDCTSLKSIDLPDSVTSIGESAFYNCSGMTSVSIGDGMGTIGRYAFYNCSALTQISFGKCSPTMYQYAFDGCVNLHKLYIEDVASWCGADYRRSSSDPYYIASASPMYHGVDLYLNGELVTELVIPDSVMTINTGAFYNCDSITTLNIGSSVLTVWDYAFSSCGSLSDMNYRGIREQWEAVSVGSNNTPLDNASKHFGTHSLVGIEIAVMPSKTVYKVGDTLNTAGMMLKAVYADGCTANIRSGFSTVGFESSTAGEKTVSVSWQGETATFTVTVELGDISGTCGEDLVWSLDTEGLLVISGTGAMDHYEFYNMPWYTCRDLIKSVMITDGVTTIGAAAFDSCRNLVQLSVPDSLTAIGDGAFYRCLSLKNVSFSGSSEQWQEVSIGSDNGCLTNADINYVESVYENLTVKTLPGKLQYYTGELLDTTGLVLTLEYFGGVSVELTEGFTASCDMTTAGTKTVTVTFKGISTSYEITVVDANEKQAIVSHPQSVTVDSGETVQFTVVTSGMVASYQWQYRKLYSWINTSLSGCNTNTLTVSATGARNGYDYRCVVTYEDGTVLYSEPAELTARTYLVVVSSPNDQTVVLGYKGQFTAEASGEGVKYQWQYKRTGSEKWIDTAMEGATKATVLIETTTARNGYQYRCRITDVTGNEAYTEAATLRVLSFTAHPETVMTSTGTTVQFTVGTSVTDGFTYQWQYRRSATGAWSNTSLTGYNTATLTVEATKAKNGYQYRCVLRGSKNSTIQSNAATLYAGDPVVISSQPVDATAAVGKTVKFIVEASNVYSYQWYYSKNGTTWNKTTMTGAATNTLSVSVTAARNGYSYKCLITGYNGTEVYTNTVKLTVG